MKFFHTLCLSTVTVDGMITTKVFSGDEEVRMRSRNGDFESLLMVGNGGRPYVQKCDMFWVKYVEEKIFTHKDLYYQCQSNFANNSMLILTISCKGQHPTADMCANGEFAL